PRCLDLGSHECLDLGSHEPRRAGRRSRGRLRLFSAAARPIAATVVVHTGSLLIFAWWFCGRVRGDRPGA
ncbi:hypothetical protein, partial [Streptomyces milbemycinicus]